LGTPLSLVSPTRTELKIIWLGRRAARGPSLLPYLQCLCDDVTMTAQRIFQDKPRPVASTKQQNPNDERWRQEN